ncbi:hypothetical protein JCM19000A_03280 [Silvimonas sp. JCM 19000]
MSILLKATPVLAFAAALGASLAHAAPAARAGDTEYAQNMGRVYQGIREAQAERDVCSALYPATASANNKAWSQWQSNNKALVDEYTRRYDAYLHQLAGPKKEKYRQYRVIQDGKYAEAATARKAALQRAGEQGKASCVNYPTALNSTLDPARRFSREIAASRRSAPKA